MVATVERLLERWPELVVLLRGADVASHELSAESWQLGPLLRRMRVRADAAAARLVARGTPRTHHRLAWGQTFHAGEEALVPWQGLRRIDELVHRGVLREGDRIGHGLVLGVEAASFAGRPLVQRRQGRLLDLAWLLELARRPGGPPLSSGLLERLRGEAERLLEPAGAAWDLACWQRAYRRLAWHTRWADLLAVAMGQPPRDELLRRWWRDERLQGLLAEPVEVRLEEQETDALEAVRVHLVERLAALGVTLEVNPTSNVLIGDGPSDFARHPLFRIAPLRPDAGGLPVAVADDDPLIFTTSLADEVVYLVSAMQLRGLEAAPLRDWVERARRAGWEARFTLPASLAEPVLRELRARLWPAGRPRGRRA